MRLQAKLGSAHSQHAEGLWRIVTLYPESLMQGGQGLLTDSKPGKCLAFHHGIMLLADAAFIVKRRQMLKLDSCGAASVRRGGYRGYGKNTARLQKFTLNVGQRDQHALG